MDQASEKIGVGAVEFAKILNFLPYPFAVSAARGDHGQTALFFNNKFTEEIGYTIEEMPTIQEWFYVSYPEEKYRQEIIAEWRRLEASAKANNQDFAVMKAKIRTKNHGDKWYEIKSSIGGPIYFIAFINIDEEIIYRQELHRMNENKDRILSILSHDLRTPLNSLDGVLQLATSARLTEFERDQLLKKIRNQVFQMSEFLETTLQWTRMNFSGIVSTQQVIDIRKITKSIIDLYTTSWTKKDIQVKMSIINDAGILGDPEIFSIAFRNLISNAIKFTPEHGSINVSDENNNGKYVVSVENSGEGLSPDKITKIFGQDHISEVGTDGEKGLGLGLKLCMRLLEKSGGRLEAESPDSTRTIFRIIM